MDWYREGICIARESTIYAFGDEPVDGGWHIVPKRLDGISVTLNRPFTMWYEGNVPSFVDVFVAEIQSYVGMSVSEFEEQFIETHVYKEPYARNERC